jgi:hypothetical protein
MQELHGHLILSTNHKQSTPFLFFFFFFPPHPPPPPPPRAPFGVSDTLHETEHSGISKKKKELNIQVGKITLHRQFLTATLCLSRQIHQKMNHKPRFAVTNAKGRQNAEATASDSTL